MRHPIVNIQRFSIHDGPGIRTTIFFKGCSLHCPWCSNPETISPLEEYGRSETKCIGKDHCGINPACFAKKSAQLTESDYQLCVVGGITKYGIQYTDEELMAEIEKDGIFYGEEGGVTLSGGEPLLSIPQYKELLERIHRKYNIAIETSLFAPTNNLKMAFDYVDSFIVDMKIIEKSKCLGILGGNIDLYLSNLEILFSEKDPKGITIRVPLIPELTNTNQNLSDISELLNRYKPGKVQLLPVHNLAMKKYDSLGKEFIRYAKITEADIAEAVSIINYNNVEVLHI